MSDIVERLRNVAAAYPEEFFPPFTQEELDEHSVIISRASGRMGRFLSKHMTEAAAEIERLREENAALRERESGAIRERNDAEARVAVQLTRINELEARLAEAVELLHRVYFASRIDVLMEGPRLSGWNRPELDRLWPELRDLVAKLEGR